MAYPRPKAATPSIKADFKLINYQDYDDFLLSSGTTQDRCYLDSEEVTRQFAELGYRSTGEAITREEFKKRVAAVNRYLNPRYEPFVMASERLESHSEPVLVELALRERANRVGIISTIIFLRCIEKGVEISGYIDYAHRLGSEDWKPIFTGRKRLKPTVTDLGFYNWQTGRVISNDSFFYRVKCTKRHGLMYQHVYDRLMIMVDPKSPPGENTTKKNIKSDTYEQAYLLDHVVRQRI
ncbi:unnamed protein product [Phaedon cochleariae]|uniref:Cilia- and flagella-associated protein 299 n=1 Tax=Phaedon cochleariae TaxID=80249 RepID=A0A9P0DQW5_PHACE|nr:unnamed protein product [Phaedon cochleariae]